MKAKIDSLDKKTTKHGNPYYTIVLDGVRINDFDDKRCGMYETEIKVGDTVEYDTVQNGQWTNLSHLEKVEA
jgi:hypothetical protein